MAKTKKFSFFIPTSGLTVYAVVIQRDTGYYLNDADGVFAVAPVDMYQEVTESGTLSGLYQYNESRTAWSDGPYEIVCYSQLGGTPVPLTDTPIATGSFNIVGDSTPVTYSPVAGSYTLAQLVSKWRLKLDDAQTATLWSNDEYTEAADNLQKQLCAEFRLLEDRTTAGICTVALAQGDGLIDLSPRITRIKQAVLDGETTQLQILSAQDMDRLYDPGWEAAAVAQDTPTVLVVKGVGLNKAYLYPPLDAALGGTLKLVVYRLPLVDLDYTTHSAQSLEIDKYAHLLYNGIMMQLYLKADAETYDPKKSERHAGLWELDKEKIRVMVHQEDNRERCSPGLHPGLS